MNAANRTHSCAALTCVRQASKNATAAADLRHPGDVAPFDDKDEDRRLTPQRKKAYSYAQDGRNTYGENAKSSRKNIPLRKRLVNKANRHADRQLLSEATGAPDLDTAEAAEQRAQGRRPRTWRKVPDQRLGAYLARRRSNRDG